MGDERASSLEANCRPPAREGGCYPLRILNLKRRRFGRVTKVGGWSWSDLDDSLSLRLTLSGEGIREGRAGGGRNQSLETHATLSVPSAAAALNCSGEEGDVMRRFAAAFSAAPSSSPPLSFSLPETATSCNLDIVKGRDEKRSPRCCYGPHARLLVPF